MVLYFAYGSNLSKTAMRRRAPNAKPVIASLLPEHRLVFESNEPPGSMEAFFANVRPALGASVLGALYAIGVAEFASLDIYEDVGCGVYERVEVLVTCADGHRERALAYCMRSGRRLRSGLPSRVQLEQIRAGYADWGLDLRVLDAALSAIARIS